jgi:phage antirepressor YoqD-like protein
MFCQHSTWNATKIGSTTVIAEQIIGQDQFGFNYLIKNNVFYKIKDLNILEYKNISLGRISEVDIKNPLKIVLFFENFNTVILLDNQLSEIQKINLSQNAEPIIATTTGIAALNQLWIYNSLDQQLGLYDYLKNSYKSIATSFTEAIKYSQSTFNYFYWIDSNNNYFYCDLFGKITSKGKIPDYDLIKFTNENEYLYSKNDVLFIVDLQKKESHEIKILEKSFANFDYHDQILSIFTKEEIINYKITTP